MQLEGGWPGVYFFMPSSKFINSSFGETSSGYSYDNKNKLTNKMGTQSDLNYSDIGANKPRKIARRVSLVSPLMDVDVTGVSLKNVRTHLIDHPRDEGLKHREQLWNFQQRYRGAIGKLKEIGSSSTTEEQRQDTSVVCDNDDEAYTQNVKPSYVDQTSLSSRFQRRLRHKIRLASMRPGDYFDSARRRVSSKEPPKEEERRPSIQRLYSSGLLVKNNLYNQIRQVNNDDRDDSKILAAIEKYGSLEKLPDIPYTPSRSSITPRHRYIKSFSTCDRRTSDDATPERRYISIRRSLTNISDVESRSKRLVIIPDSARRNERFLHCLDSENEEEEDDNGDVDDDEIDEDECDSEPQDIESTRRDCDPKHPDHIDIRYNITKVHTQDDMLFLEKRLHEDNRHRNGYVTERTERTYYTCKKTITIPRKSDTYKENFECNGIAASAKSSSESSKSNQGQRNKSDKNAKDAKQSNKKGNNKKSQKDTFNDALNRTDSTESLDIPGDRYGPTTHSMDKKLSIRKPWEWKPSPYRWIDRAYVRESDKPYIERIINNGEIIDEFNYDSFARTRPLKLQSFPDGAGYKDRYGNLR